MRVMLHVPMKWRCMWRGSTGSVECVHITWCRCHLEQAQLEMACLVELYLLMGYFQDACIVPRVSMRRRCIGEENAQLERDRHAEVRLGRMYKAVRAWGCGMR
jgi:hypothetical protein